MKKLGLLVFLVMTLGLVTCTARADGSFKGYMFGDFYYVGSHHNEDLEGRNGFWFRRIYFTYNNQLSGFAVISASEKLDLIARYDKMLDSPVHKTIDYIPFSTEAPSNLIIGAISYEVLKNMWLMPNIKYAFYDEPEMGEKPSEDTYINLSFWYKFK